MSRTFKHKNTRVTGVLHDDGHLHFQRVNGETAACETLHFSFVENSNDWEEIKEKPKAGKILSLITHSFVGVTTAKSDIDAFLEKHSGTRKWDVHSLKRLSDGEIFTIGDFLSEGTILRLRLTADDRFQYSCFLENEWKDISNAIKDKRIGITEDNVYIYENMIIYSVPASLDSINAITAIVPPGYSGKNSNVKHPTYNFQNGDKYFSTIQAAKEYIIKNTKFLTLANVEKQCNSVSEFSNDYMVLRNFIEKHIIITINK